MATRKNITWIGGLLLATAGTVLLYFESYRNNSTLNNAAVVMILAGWSIAFAELTKGTSIYAKKIFFRDDRPGWFWQRASNLFYYLLLFAIVGGDWFGIRIAANVRKEHILTDGPTQTTVATVGYISIWHGRRSTYYDTVFEYTANNKFTSYPWSEKNEDDFSVGDKYLIRYSVEYPEMFVLERKLK